MSAGALMLAACAAPGDRAAILAPLCLFWCSPVYAPAIFTIEDLPANMRDLELNLRGRQTEIDGGLE